MSNKLDITSTVLEKGIDVAKDFLDKLIFPAVEETGLLLKDQVTRWRFNNQIKILNSAKKYCDQNNIKTKNISLKLLCPLLEGASLEEDNVLQDKWAILLGNLVDSDQNIENHVFPYILGQISINEFSFIEQSCIQNNNRIHDLQEKIQESTRNRINTERETEEKIKEIRIDIKTKEVNEYFFKNLEVNALHKEISELESKIRSMKYVESSFMSKINQPQILEEKKLKEFEISNLTRLGLIRLRVEPYANSQTLEIPNDREGDYIQVDIDVDVDSKIDYTLTQLGELFIEACTDKKQQKS